ncbi:hypothetical protein F4859DRAFT_460046 [Xylaria cf. heliscus]|nr:hypothetical protein F4859DRAFT_460046 [Xylaria cf. heliscus]
MLKDFFDSTTNGAGDDEDIAELVVTALGTSGTHYMCWKTNSGEYRQRSYGLPAQLQEWLFPTDGTTRDFATLQVILLSDNAFWASDKNGEIRNDGPSSLKQLRRALTFHDGNLLSTHQRRSSRGRDIEQNSERPRSSTLPANLSRENTMTGKQLRPLFSHGRAESLDKSRLGPAVPVAVRRHGRASGMRPRSIDTSFYRELEVLKEQPTPRPSATLPTPSGLRYNATSDLDSGRREESNMRQGQPTPAVYNRPSYVDSSMQTEPEPAPDVAEHEHQECRCLIEDHSSQRDSAVSFGLSSKSSKSGVDTPITRPDSGFFDSGWEYPHTMVPNPIVMGRMQDYFRSTTYVLGAALHPQGMG